MNYVMLIQQIAAYYILYLVINMSAHANGESFIYAWPFLPALLFMFAYGHNTICVQAAHVTKQVYNPWTNILLFNMIIHSAKIALEALNM